jgi:penicillin-binding protein 1B
MPMGSRRKPSRKKSKQGKFYALRALLLFSLGGLLGFGTPYLWWLNRLLNEQMEVASWQAPTRVYSRSLELQRGQLVDTDRMIADLQAAGYRQGNGRTPGSFRLTASEVSIRGRGVFPGFADGVRFSLVDGKISGLDGNDRLEPVLIGTVYSTRDRLPVSLGEVPAELVLGLQAVEDRQFKHHHGISLRAIARALWANLRQGSIVQGGSTLSQQLVKTLFLTRERRWLRKLHEASLAALMEYRFAKDQILEAYLNEVFLGQDGHRAIHGVGRAAEFYFGRSLQQLDLRSHALLVGLLKGPSYFNPWRHPQRAVERRNRVLQAMYDTGVISRTQWHTAKRQSLGVLAAPGGASGNFPAFMGLVRQQLGRGDRTVGQGGGLHVETGLSLRHQRAAETALAGGLKRIEQARGLPAESLEGAVVILDRNDGSILAAVGGRDAGFAGFNRVRDARRPIGSLVKPFVYLAALDSGSHVLSSRVADEAFALQMDDGQTWSPDNFDHLSHGQVSLIEALVHSYNQATARVGLEVGVKQVVTELLDLGLTRRPLPHPSLLLGALELSPLDVGQLYLSLANGGRAQPVHAVRRVVDSAHQIRFAAVVPNQNRPDPDAWLIRYALQRVISDGTGRSLANHLGAGSGLAGKTGTSNGLRDSWFVGFGENQVVVVWVGRDDNASAGITGATGAMQVFAGVIRELGWQPLSTEPPENVQFHWVSEDRLADDHCPDRDYLPFRAGTEPEDWADCARPRKTSWWRFWKKETTD